MIRLAGLSLVIAASIMPAAHADEVRHLTFAASLVGTWGLSGELCAAKDKSNIQISDKRYVDADVDCAVDWIVETAGRPGPNYGVHAMCANPATPDQRRVANLLIRPQADGRIVVDKVTGAPQTYQRCPSQ
jgi:hypothetical protein